MTDEVKVAKKFIWGTGRRKSAVARVRLSIGTGNVTVNKRKVEEYFPAEQDIKHATEPLVATKTRSAVDTAFRTEAMAPGSFFTLTLNSVRDLGEGIRPPQLLRT